MGKTTLLQADEIGCHIITVTSDVLKKVSLIGKDLHDYSLETVQMFHNDAAHSGYTLDFAREEPSPAIAGLGSSGRGYRS